MEPKLERCHDAEIAAAPAQRPEEIRMLCRASLHKGAVGCDDVSRHQIVDRQSELAGGPAEAAAECQSGDAGRRVDAEGGREAERLRFPVEIRKRCARFDARGARDRIDVDRLHQRKID